MAACKSKVLLSARRRKRSALTDAKLVALRSSWTSITSKRRFIPAVTSLGLATPLCKEGIWAGVVALWWQELRRCGTAGSREKPLLDTKELQWADNLGQLAGHLGLKDEWVMGEQP